MEGIEAVSSIKDIWMYAHRMIRSARQIINAELKPLNLSSAQGNILLHLLMGDSEMPQERLADELDIGKAAISRALASLEEKGYVTRKAHPFDKRARLVTLTEKATAIGSAVEGVYNHVFDIVRRGIPDEEYDRIVLLMSRIAGNLSAVQLSGVQAEVVTAETVPSEAVRQETVSPETPRTKAAQSVTARLEAVRPKSVPSKAEAVQSEVARSEEVQSEAPHQNHFDRKEANRC